MNQEGFQVVNFSRCLGRLEKDAIFCIGEISEGIVDARLQVAIAQYRLTAKNKPKQKQRISICDHRQLVELDKRMIPLRTQDEPTNQGKTVTRMDGPQKFGTVKNGKLVTSIWLQATWDNCIPYQTIWFCFSFQCPASAFLGSSRQMMAQVIKSLPPLQETWTEFQTPRMLQVFGH